MTASVTGDGGKKGKPKAAKAATTTGKGLFPQAYGADVLRLWVASTDFSSDVVVGPTVMASVSEALRKVRNTCRFLLGSSHVSASDRLGEKVRPCARNWLHIRRSDVHQ